LLGYRCAIPQHLPEPSGLLEPAGLAARPKQATQCRGRSVAITLQSTVGGFSPEFMRQLPRLEQAMVAHGLEPSQFVISKDWATQAAVPLPFLRPFFYDYTVFIGEENFTVTEPNDSVFLDYFYQRCIADDETAPEQPPERRAGLISRVFRWMAQPI
jgi:hypothetical protein